MVYWVEKEIKLRALHEDLVFALDSLSSLHDQGMIDSGFYRALCQGFSGSGSDPVMALQEALRATVTTSMIAIAIAKGKALDESSIPHLVYAGRDGWLVENSDEISF